MFWRFGLLEDSRPVVAAVWLKVVWSRPSASISSRQRVEVGLGELGQLAPALDLGDHRVLVADRLQHPGVGRVAGLAAALARQPELAEQDLLELLGRAERELLAAQLEDLALELVGLGLDPRRRSRAAARCRASARPAPSRAAPAPAAARPRRAGRSARARGSPRAASRPARATSSASAAAGSSTSVRQARAPRTARGTGSARRAGSSR